MILENPPCIAYAHLIGGFFYALNDIYTQGGRNTIYINRDILDNIVSIIFDRATYKTTKNQEKIRKTNYLVQNQEITTIRVNKGI